MKTGQKELLLVWQQPKVTGIKKEIGKIRPNGTILFCGGGWLKKNLVKGDKIYLEGRLRTRSWDDENGQKRYTTEIQGDKVLKLSSTGSQPYSSESAAQDIDQNTSTNETTKTDNGTMEEDDLPF
jgi:hypothetical protein